MFGLLKFAVVTESGTWLDLLDNLAAARALSERNPGTHVERWVYPVLPDGTHGAPFKTRLPCP